LEHDQVGLNRMLAISVTGLTRRYGDLEAVRGIDLEVNIGECVAILGPNGAGKTTTIEILEGFRRRDGGTVSVLGVDPSHGDVAWRSRIGIVSQSASDLGLARVGEALDHFGRYYPSPRSTDELLALVGLEAARNQRVSQLSGGQRRRFDVALGLVGSPEILFLDEPTTGFDPEARRDFWQLIQSLRASNTTVLLTTHYLEEADALADRIVVIAAGKKIADTTPSQLGERHRGGAQVYWREGDEVRSVTTPTPTAFIAELASRVGPEIPGLEVQRMTLENAYLALIDEAEHA
jgi:ABC-2 type transport system ATP-binding protein